jgi:hypothetical protein
MSGPEEKVVDGTTKPPLVVCVDVGSIPEGHFAWATSGDQEPTSDSKSIEALVERIRQALHAGQSVALGLEAPLSIPDVLDPSSLGKKRVADGSRPWSAAAGAFALATGLAQLRWLLRKLEPDLCGQRISVSFDPRDLFSPQPVLVIWEAMVTGKAKGRESDSQSGDSDAHYADAQTAADEFERLRRVGQLPQQVPSCVSLAGMLVDALQLPKQARLADRSPVIVKPTELRGA